MSINPFQMEKAAVRVFPSATFNSTGLPAPSFCCVMDLNALC